MAPPVLAGPRVLLRPPRTADKEARRLLGLSPEVLRGYGIEIARPQEMSPAQAERAYASMLLDEYGWAIEIGARFAGYIGLHHLEHADQRASLRIGIDDVALLGKGFGTEAVLLVARYAFGELGLHRLSLRVLASNTRAIRCYETCGFKVEGRERESARVGGSWADDLLMGLLAADLPPGTA